MCDREEESGHIATMLQCVVYLLTAGFEGEAAGFFVDCFDFDAGQRTEWGKDEKFVHFMHQFLVQFVCGGETKLLDSV